MKRKTSVLIMASVLTLASASAFSDESVTPVTVNGGTVHFEGELVNAACAVNVGSGNQTVLLGQRRTATLSEAGKVSDKVGFNIQLDDCVTTVWKNASVAFKGIVDENNPKVLTIISSGPGSATNVGIQVLDNEGKVLGFDGSDYSTATTLNNGTNILPFAARYYAIGEATPGTANADATFVVKYE